MTLHSLWDFLYKVKKALSAILKRCPSVQDPVHAKICMLPYEMVSIKRILNTWKLQINLIFQQNTGL